LQHHRFVIALHSPGGVAETIDLSPRKKGDPFERQARGSGNLAASFERNPLRRKET
jgi:hypothetical protein